VQSQWPFTFSIGFWQVGQSCRFCGSPGCP